MAENVERRQGVRDAAVAAVAAARANDSTDADEEILAIVEDMERDLSLQKNRCTIKYGFCGIVAFYRCISNFGLIF